MKSTAVPFEEYAAGQLVDRRAELARRWVEMLASELQVRPRRALPDDLLMSSVSVALERVAEFVRSDEIPALTRDERLRETLRELARQRYRHGHDPQELMRELDVLARVLDAACLEWLGECPSAPAPAAVVRVAGRLNRAPILMAEIVIGAYREAEAEDRATATRQLRDFAETLSHELNTPLGAAESAALLLEDDAMVATTQQRRHFAGLIQRNLRRARTVIGDVRELALAGASDPASGRWLPVGQVIGEVLAEVGTLLRGARVRLEVAEPLPDLVVDAARVEIILLNLLSNAAKYADPARPSRWIRLAIQRDEAENACRISVSDNGLGIPPELHGRIFQRFFRAHPERAEGTGLGLPIVRDAVEQLGGRIEFQSEPGVGTTFHVTLPLLAAE